MSHRRPWLSTRLVLALAAAALAACDTSADRGPLVDPPLPPGKADVADVVPVRAALAFGEDAAVTAAFAHDLEFHGYTLSVAAGAVVGLDVAHKGSSSKLDTTLYVYGPQNDAGGFGASAIAFDDDAGWGRLSRLRPLELAASGTYLIVVGTRDGRGRGHYRLVTTCPAGDCAPTPAPPAGCHPQIAAAVEACVADWQADPDYDPAVVSHADLIEQCADAEPVAPALDALCVQPEAPAELCQVDYETFATTHLPLCRRQLTEALLDQACVFGDTYRDALRSDAVVVLWSRTLTQASPLTALEADQVVRAVRTTSHQVDTAPQAFTVVDQGQVVQTELWDASGRRAFTAYELGAGDNSYGLFFHHGSLTPAARINDGDLLDCDVTWGPERRRCATSDDCAEGLSCVGRPEGAPWGRCIDLRADDHPEDGAPCVGLDGCPAGAGLVCGGAVSHPEQQGLCLPAWMRAHFDTQPDLPIPDGGVGATAQLLVHGLASVDVDATIDLLIEHPRPSDLTVTLTNPAGNELVLTDPTWAAPEIHLRGLPLRGLSGDESVNGPWTLLVRDVVKGQTGVLHHFALTLTSRWD